MSNHRLFFLLLMLFATTLSAQSFSVDHLYPIEGSHSFIQFEATYMGYAKVRGNFGDFKGSIYYDPEAPDRTSVSFQIEVASIDTDNDWRDRDLQSDNWFLAEEYPYIQFTSTGVRRDGEQFLVSGDLTIKATTKRIEFRIPPPIGVIEDIRGDYQVIFVGEYTLNRKEYGVMGKNWSRIKEGIAALADEVTIEFSLLGKRIQPDNLSNFLRNPNAPPGGIYAAYTSDGIEAAISRYEEMAADTSVNLNARALNLVGNMLMMQEKYADARVLMERNQRDFPEEGRLYDSLGELYAKMGEYDKATEYYRRALALDEGNMNAREALRHLEK